MTTDLDSTRSAAVDHGYHWQPMSTCPKGSKVHCAQTNRAATEDVSLMPKLRNLRHRQTVLEMALQAPRQ